MEIARNRLDSIIFSLYRSFLSDFPKKNRNPQLINYFYEYGYHYLYPFQTFLNINKIKWHFQWKRAVFVRLLIFVCLNSVFCCTNALFFKFFFLILHPQTESPRCMGGEVAYIWLVLRRWFDTPNSQLGRSWTLRSGSLVKKAIVTLLWVWI